MGVILYALALVCLVSGELNFEALVKEFREELKRDPSSIDTHLRLGEALLGMDRKYEAGEAFEEALKLATKVFDKQKQKEINGRLSLLHLRTGNAVGCIKASQEALVIDPSDLSLRLTLARCQFMGLEVVAFAKTMCAPTKIALLNEASYDVYYLFMLAWASCTDKLEQAKEFLRKCDVECTFGDKKLYEEIRAFILEPDQHPMPQLALNRKKIGSKGEDISRLLAQKCVAFLRPKDAVNNVDRVWPKYSDASFGEEIPRSELQQEVREWRDMFSANQTDQLSWLVPHPMVALRMPYDADELLLISQINAKILAKSVVHIPAVVLETNQPLFVALHVGDLSESNPMISNIRAFVRYFVGKLLVFYHQGDPFDGVAPELFVSLAGLTDRDAAIRIRGSGANLLLETSWWTETGKPGVALHHPLPVSVLWCTEFPASAGSHYAFDYLVTDGHSMHSTLTEYPLMIGHSFYFSDLGERYGTRLMHVPKARRSPEQALVLISINDPRRLTQATFDLWAEAAKQVPSMQIVMRRHMDERKIRERWTEHHGLAADRLVMKERISPKDLASLGDFSADFPEYNGGEETLLTLVAGLPVVHLDGPYNKTVERRGAGILRSVGLENLIASSAAEYVKKIVELASQPQTLAAIRSRLEGAVNCNSDAMLFCAKELIETFQIALERTWTRYGSNQPRTPIHLGMKVEMRPQDEL